MEERLLISAVVVLFKPSDETYQNIQSYIRKVERLYVVDNSPEPSEIVDRLLQEEKVKLLSSSVNIGLAEAYNLGLKSAQQDGCRWLMTMDQDSFFKSKQLKRFFLYFSQVSKESLGVYAPLHNPKFLSIEREKSVTVLMSSASIINVVAALEAGGFDEALFIDEVDHEFCLRAGLSGYAVLQNCQVYVDHKLGENLQNGKKKYSGTRLYYMVRNHLYIRKKYEEAYPDYFNERDRYMRKFIAGQLRHHQRKLHRTAMVFLGIWDYIWGRMGKRVMF